MRIKVIYTVPALRELREMTIEYNNRKKAESHYWKLVRGAHFFPPEAGSGIKFLEDKLEPSPW